MSTQSNLQDSKEINPSAMLHMLVLYIIWGSTYLAIRIGVRPGSGFPPFTLGLMRVTVAGILLLLWAALTKKRIKPTRTEMITLFASGILLWTGGNGLVMYAEQRADSGLAALLVGSMPIFSAIIEAFLDRKRPSLVLVVSLLLGFLGIGLLTAPVLLSGVRADVLSVIALILAPISWGIGSILQARKPVQLAPRVSSGYQMLSGGIGFLVLVLLLKEPAAQPTLDAWLAWGYLVIFGAVIAFTSFVTALQLLPTSIVMTYAYVNPVIAVILGWLILREEITAWTIGGSLLVLVGVWGVFRERYGKKDS